MPDTNYLNTGDWGLCMIRYPVADYPDKLAVVNAAITAGYIAATGLEKDQLIQEEGQYMVLHLKPTPAFEEASLDNETLQNGVILVWGLVRRPGTVEDLPKSLDAAAGFKAIDETQRTISGWASTPDVDHTGDIVLPTAFEKSFKRNATPPVCFQHDLHNVIGRVIEYRIDSVEGLWITAKISKTVTKEWDMVKEGIIKNFSFGYKILNSYYDKGGHRVITDLDLLEVSLVGVPMNDHAEVMAFSGKALDGFVAELTEIRKAVAEDQEYIKSVSDELAPVVVELSLIDIAGDLLEGIEYNKRMTGKVRELITTLGGYSNEGY